MFHAEMFEILPLIDGNTLKVLVAYMSDHNMRLRSTMTVGTLSEKLSLSTKTVVEAKKALRHHGCLIRVPAAYRLGAERDIHHRMDVVQLTGVFIDHERNRVLRYLNIPALERELQSKIYNQASLSGIFYNITQIDFWSKFFEVEGFYGVKSTINTPDVVISTPLDSPSVIYNTESPVETDSPKEESHITGTKKSTDNTPLTAADGAPRPIYEVDAYRREDIPQPAPGDVAVWITTSLRKGHYIQLPLVKLDKEHLIIDGSTLWPEIAEKWDSLGLEGLKRGKILVSGAKRLVWKLHLSLIKNWSERGWLVLRGFAPERLEAMLDGRLGLGSKAKLDPRGLAINTHHPRYSPLFDALVEVFGNRVDPKISGGLYAKTVVSLLSSETEYQPEDVLYWPDWIKINDIQWGATATPAAIINHIASIRDLRLNGIHVETEKRVGYYDHLESSTN